MPIKKSIERKSSNKSSKVPKTKEAFKSHISFHFKDLRNPKIEYAAHYNSKGITGEWFDVQIKSDGNTFYQNKAWTKFRENANFDDILQGLRTYDIHDVVSSSGKPDFMDFRKWADRKFLKELSVYPEWLAYPETGATTRLISLLKTVQVANSDKARQASENLKDYLIPRRPGSSRYYPENLEEGLFLLKKLSKYIGSRCKQFLSDGEGAIEDEYSALQKWGKTEEPRIVGMPEKDLALLTYKPALFAQKALCKELFSSPASLKSALKKV